MSCLRIVNRRAEASILAVTSCGRSLFRYEGRLVELNPAAGVRHGAASRYFRIARSLLARSAVRLRYFSSWCRTAEANSWVWRRRRLLHGDRGPLSYLPN